MELLRYMWLLLPAAFANMSASFSSKVFPNWTSPVDFNHMFRGKRILGDHKTIRGVVCGGLIGFLIFILQRQFLHQFQFFRNLELFDLNQLPIYSGIFLGLGGLTGDMIKSFFKRQVGISPGESWFPWDQVDWILGTTAVWVILADVKLDLVLKLAIFGLMLSLTGKAIGYILKLDNKYI